MPSTLRSRCRSLHTTCIVCVLSVTTVSLASGQQPSEKTERPAADQGHAKPKKAQGKAQRLKKAKLLFRKGNAMRKAGDCERALFFFRRSRQAMAGVPNIVNGAICLEELGRYDEALESYEELLTEFGGQLGRSQREAVVAAMRRLRPVVGSVLVSSNVPARVLIDGRERARLPHGTSIRVMPGRHMLRVEAEGFEAQERDFTATKGQNVRLVVKLVELGTPRTRSRPTTTSAKGPAKPDKKPVPRTPAPQRTQSKRQPAHSFSTSDNDGTPWSLPGPIWTWATAAGALVLGGVAVGFAVDQRNVQQDIDQHCNASTCTMSDGFDPQAANARLARDFGLFVGLGSASIVGLGIATYGFVTSKTKTAGPDRAWIVLPVVNRNQWGLQLTGRLQ